MDCIIPGYGVRPFSSAIACLCKIGKELYINFDPIDGLTLRTLNDAKSAYASFHFEPGFFERCAAPPPIVGEEERRRGGRRSNNGEGRQRGGGGSRKRPRQNDDDDEDRDNDGENEEGKSNDESDGYSCRVSLRTVHSILKSRKGVRSLRIRGGVGGASSSIPTTSSSHRRPRLTDEEENEDLNQNNLNSSLFSSSQGSSSLVSGMTMMMQLSFEFHTENTKTHGGTMRIIHRIGVCDADGVTAVATRDGCSEIVAPPKVLMKMLEPLKRTNEVALTVNDSLKVVTATSFHHGDAAAAAAAAASSSATPNILLSAASASVLKTETSIASDEFDDYNYRDDRGLEGEEAAAVLGTPPENANEEVMLVFGIKEAKAMIQFCSQANYDEELRVILSFHWGGRPVIFETEGESFSAELIMATLDHKLLAGMSAMRERANRRTSDGNGGGGGGGSASRRSAES
mmetsp:Transcript_37526/g.54945  ORF Transcript_37526/g.54945 Transcript_37526/m.54945 type:complete len:458 (+) Transcript_37526:195-1568(+)